MHQPCHHDTVGLYAHATGTDVSAQEPGAVCGGLLAVLDHLIRQVLEHQRMRIAQKTGVGGVGGNLVVKEQAPVVTVGHGQFAIAECQPIENLLHHLVIMMHQGVGMPFFCTVKFLLEEFQGQGSLAQFLNDHILIGGVEIIMVLEREVVIEVLTLVEVFHGLVIVCGVDDGGVGGIILM